MEQIRVEWAAESTTLTQEGKPERHQCLEIGFNGYRIITYYRDRKGKKFYTVVAGDKYRPPTDTYGQPALQGTPKADTNVYQFKPS
jgi:hypothetical protein